VTASFGGDASLQGWGTGGGSSRRAEMNSHGGGNSEPRHRHEPGWRRPQAPTASSSGGASLRGWGTRRQPVQSRAGLPWWRRACAVASPGYRRRRRRGLMGVAVLCVGGGGGCWGGGAMEGVDLGGGGAMKGGTAEPWRAAGRE